MSYKVLFVLNAFVAVVLGAAFLFVPDRMLGFFETDTYVYGVAGTVLWHGNDALGLVVWFADARIRSKGMGWALFISAILDWLNVLGIFLQAALFVNGWITVVIYVLFARHALILFLQ
jgi:hypothetical protein